MDKPRCPLCGARSTWVKFPFDVQYRRPDLRDRFPDDCHFCKEEERIHWKNWEQGIDITQTGGTPLDAGVEVPGSDSEPHFYGEKLG